MPQPLELRRLEIQRQMVERWNGQMPEVESGQGDGMILQLPAPGTELRR